MGRKERTQDEVANEFMEGRSPIPDFVEPDLRSSQQFDDEPEPAAPVQTVQQGDILERLTVALEALAGRQAAGPSNEMAQMMALLTKAVERITEAQSENVRAIARTQHRASNEVVPFRTVLNPRGQRDFPKPTLKCEMFIPWSADPDSMTREEIELCNLLQSGEYIIKKTDGSRAKVEVKITYALDEVTPSRLILASETAFNNDNKNWIPPLTDLLRAILRQHKDPSIVRAAAEVLSMEEEEALIATKQLEVSV